jgi:sigma-B regulation protein RsbU (phosphoserine phosphatase)
MTEERQDQLESLRAEVERLTHERQQEVDALDELVRISTQLNSTLKLSELLQLIMNSAKDLLRAETCSIALRDEETGDLVFEMAVGTKSQEVHKQRVPAGRGIAGQVASTGEPLVVDSTRDNPHFFDQIDQATGFQSRNMLALPIKVKGATIGVMEVINSQGRDSFHDRDLRLGQALASHAAVAIDNANLYQKLADALVTSRMSYRL